MVWDFTDPLEISMDHVVGVKVGETVNDIKYLAMGQTGLPA
jgi:hypothetical protein